MTQTGMRSRRQVLALLVTTALGTALRAAAAGPLDQGIGGTGAAPPVDESDRGIGGTGVIGTIRKFGSIIVNDLRIAYPPDASVFIDGRPASPSDLKIGQVVRVTAAGRTGTLSTQTINVTSEVVGRVERVGPKQITVLGQTVATAGLGKPSVRVGDTVAVSGLRCNDGTIVASLIEPRPGATSHVAGPVRLADDGGFKIGGLRLSGIDPSLNGQRALVEGQADGDRLVVSRATSEMSLLPDVRTLSVESYVERRGDRLALGSGLAVANPGRLEFPAGRSVRAVLTTTLARDGRLSVDSLRANGRTYGSAPRAGTSRGERGGMGRAPAPGSNGRIPMDFNHGPSVPRAGQGSPEGGFGGRPGGGPGGGGPGGGFGGPFGGGGPGGRR